MKRILLYSGILLVTYGLSVNYVTAQAPSISYSPQTNVFTKGTAITTLTPTTAGGAVPATTYSTVSTLAGTTTSLNNPRGLATDGSGNIYEADFTGNIINKISSTGTVTLASGSGTAGEKNGNKNSSKYDGPWGIVYDGSANLYVCDNTGNAIRKVVAANGTSTTLAGPTNGTPGETDGTGGSATFTGPMGIAYDGTNNYLYVCDNGGNKIRRIAISTGAVLTIAGSGTGSESDSPTGTSATFNGPAGIVYDGAGNLYVSDAVG
ncbi:MAG TPA: hypothetical protein VHS53_02635, partial [Mucilaginibacter sp.]|nr:hypothetical protein [Mucilaginibacter sp.]